MKTVALWVALMAVSGACGQDSIPSWKKAAVYGSISAAAVGSMAYLSQSWYADQPRTDFHFFNDNAQWLGMDKWGHAFTTYQTGRMGYLSFRSAGMPKRSALIWGANVGFLFLAGVEVLDGFSPAWGYSPGDMLANAAGSGLFISQEALWDEQRVQIKFSARMTPYAPQRPDLLGKTPLERIIKDYNGQTYWLTTSPGMWTQEGRLPRWLGVSVGYGADGMLSGHPESALFPDQQRTRLFYLAPDILLDQIPFRSKALRLAALWLSWVKIPLPALGITDEGGLRFRAVGF